jgi:hypothetical protein
MSSRRALSMTFVGLISVWPLQMKADAQTKETPTVQIPQPGVPQVITMEGKFVRASYNREGYVILGYQASNRSIGEEWMLLEVGMTVLDDVPDYRLTRDALSLETPDGKTIPLAPLMEQRGGSVQAIQQRAKVQRDSINYFPTKASKPCASSSFPTWDRGRCRSTRWISATTARVSVVSTSKSLAALHTVSIGST